MCHVAACSQCLYQIVCWRLSFLLRSFFVVGLSCLLGSHHFWTTSEVQVAWFLLSLEFKSILFPDLLWCYMLLMDKPCVFYIFSSLTSAHPIPSEDNLVLAKEMMEWSCGFRAFLWYKWNRVERCFHKTWWNYWRYAARLHGEGFDDVNNKWHYYFDLQLK